jgi:uncharacterized protein YsxB (DUF464 family)
MISVDVYTMRDRMTEFRVSGHAEFSEPGQDIVCAAVSILVYNAINSCEKFAGVILEVRDTPKTLSFEISKPAYSPSVRLLLSSMVFGIEQLVEQYPEYVRLRYPQ